MLFPVIQHTKKLCTTVKKPTDEAYLSTLKRKLGTICGSVTNIAAGQKCHFFPFSIYSMPLVFQTRPRNASFVNHSCPLSHTTSTSRGLLQERQATANPYYIAKVLVKYSIT